MKKFGINSQMRNELFLIVIYRFSLVKSSVNAVRVCKLRNGVNKTPQFLLFSTAKCRTKTIANLDRRIYDCKLRNEKKRFNPSA
jgi:hypothetical protein